MTKNIMAIDFSTTSTGWSIFRDKRMLSCGTIKIKSKDFIERVEKTSLSLKNIAEAYGVKKIYIEQMNVINNFKTLRTLAYSHGILYGYLKDHSIEYINVNTWRKYHFKGKHSKKEYKELAIQKAKKYLLDERVMRDIESDDEAEAILIGIFAQNK